MLGKIIKNEFKATYKIMLSVLAVLALLSVMGGFAVRSLSIASDNVSIIAILGTVLYFLSFVAVFIIVIVYIGQRYYKTMFSTQGYLTHTLPAKESTIFNGKLLVSYIWVLSVFVMIFLSLFLMGTIASSGELFTYIIKEGWSLFVEEFYQQFNFSVNIFLLEMALAMILGIAYLILWIFTSLTVGQLSDKHRVAASVFTGIGIYLVEQAFSIVMVVKSAKKGVMVLESAQGASIFLNGTIWSSVIYMLILGALMYTGCLLINKKKLNLE